MRKIISNIGLVAEWFLLQIRARFVKMAAETPCMMLLPCEPWTVVGSRGDEAMITAIVQDFKKRHPDGRAIILVARSGFAESEDGQRLAAMLGVEYVCAWGNGRVLNNIFRLLRSNRVSEFYALGADCMDGHWSFFISFLLLSSSDLATRMGVKTRLTGFSFNDHPHRLLIPLFRIATKRLIFSLRDPISYKRFVNKVGNLGNARIVADVAFCLEPVGSDAVQGILSRMETSKRKGLFVLGFNLHPTLVKPECRVMFVNSVAKALNLLLEARRDISLFLIPHDYRDNSDVEVLAEIRAAVPRAEMISEVLSAGELKTITLGLDALFTSRMHLGIAALGMGCPVGGFVYQGKFEGLFGHFGLTDDFLLKASDVDNLYEKIVMLVKASCFLRTAIDQRKNEVLGLAHENLIKG